MPLLLLASCGPAAIALGINEALKDEEPDLGPPAVTFLHESGFGDAPEFIALRDADPDDDDGSPDSKTLRVVVRLDKAGARVRVDLQGPADDLPCAPFGAGDADCVTPESITDEGVEKIGPRTFLVTREIGGRTLAAHGDGHGLDGLYTLFVEVTDKQGRVIPAARQFLVDTVPPDRPGLIGVEAERPRSLTVRWTPVQDLAEPGNDDDDAVSGVAGYFIHFEVGGSDIAGGEGPGDPSIELSDEEEDAFLRSGLLPSADDTILESPVFVPGAQVGSFELTGLFAGRLHSVAVTAIDRAGNETFFDPDIFDGQPLDLRVARTRTGPDGTLLEQGWTLEDGSECRFPRLADLDEDGALDLVFVRRIFETDGTTTNTIQVFRGQTSAVENGERGVPSGEFAPWAAGAIDYGADLAAAGDAGFTEVVDLAVADFDLDGTLDLAVLDHGAGDDANKFGVRFYRGASDREDGRGADRFELVEADNPRVAGVALALAVGDLDRATEMRAGDGNVRFTPDLVVTRENGGPLLFPMKRDFHAEPSVDLAVAGARGVVLVDHDGDGLLDVTGYGDIALRTIRAERTETGYALAGAGDRQAVASVGGTIEGVVSDDFNSDGVPDLAVSLAEGSISILLGAGLSEGGTVRFGEAKQFSIGGDGGPIVVGDFNGDRIPDLAVASEGVGSITLCTGIGTDGRGTGEFVIANRLSVFLEPYGMQVGDVDRNGTPDFVVSGFEFFDDTDPGRVRVVPLGGMAGRGDGTFFDVTLERRGFEAATRVTGPEQDLIFGDAVDFDGDGVTDILASATGEPFRFIRGRGSNGQGNGTFFFGAANFWEKADYVDQLATGDFDGDGELDVVGVRLERPAATDEIELQVEMQLKRGTEFVRSWGRVDRPRQLWVDYTQDATGFPSRTETESEKLEWCKSKVGTAVPIPADMDGDGILDLVFTRCGVISILMGPIDTLPGSSADVGYSARRFYDHVFRTEGDRLLPSQHLSTTAAVADFNADGLPDIAALDLNIIPNVRTTFGLRALAHTQDIPLPGEAIADGAGVANAPVTYVLQGEDGPVEVELTLGSTGPFEYVLEVDWPEGSQPRAGGGFQVYFRESPDDPSGAVFADPSSAIADGGYRSIARLEAGSELRFTVPVTSGEFDDELANYPNPFSPWPEAQLLLVNDTGVDLPAGALKLTRGVRFDVADRSGEAGKSYSSLPGFAIDFDSSVRQHLVEVADFDADGVLDLAVLAPKAVGSALYVLKGQRDEGRGDGLFDFFPDTNGTGGNANYPFASRPFQVRSADCNGDGILDLLVITEAPSLEVLLGQADAAGRATGTFHAPRRFALVGVPKATSFVIGDFNADGIIDAAVGSAGGADPVATQGPRLLLGQGALSEDEAPEPEDD
ncbi:MAG: FG-GAP-like repeat-containing protein [Planctomycetota bacterium]